MLGFERIILVIAAMTALSGVAMGTLGEIGSSVEKDRALMGAPKKSTTTTNYTVHEISSGGNTIKEYVAPGGRVFAVSWRGIVRPDLSSLLGSYFPEYDRLSSAVPRVMGRRSERISTSKIVVIKGGHMRDLRVKAFVTELVPAEVDVEQLP